MVCSFTHYIVREILISRTTFPQSVPKQEPLRARTLAFKVTCVKDNVDSPPEILIAARVLALASPPVVL